MTEVPPTRYAVTRDGVHIAYQVVGEGALDLIVAFPWVSHLEIYWEWPGFVDMVRVKGSTIRITPQRYS